MTSALAVPPRQVAFAVPATAARRAPVQKIQSAGDFGDAGLADHGDADLAGVGEFLFDLLGHVAGQDGGGDVVDVLGADHDPDLAAGLHREDLLHAGLAGRDLLDTFQALDVD